MFWGCVSGVRGHHAKLSLAADAESARKIWGVIWTPAFRFDDGVPLMGQTVDRKKETETWSKCFNVGWTADLCHRYSSSFIVCIIILITPLRLYTLYLLPKILFPAVFPCLLSYLSSYTPPSSSFQTSLSPCSHLVLYPSPPLLCSLAFAETHPLSLSAMNTVPNIGCPAMCVCVLCFSCC